MDDLFRSSPSPGLDLSLHNLTKMIRLPSGKEVYDLSGEWDALIEILWSSGIIWHII